MNSSSLIDFFAEKIHSYSSKMRGDSLQHYSSSFLMAGNSVQQYDPLNVLNELKEYGIFENLHQRTMHFNDVLEVLGSYHNLKHLYGLEKPEVFCTQNKNTIFSPHFSNLMDVLNSFHNKSSLFDMHLMCYSSSNLNNIFDKSDQLNLKANLDLKKACVPTNESLNLKAESDLKKACVPASELKMSESVSKLPVEKKTVVTDKCGLSAGLKLNVKLAHRKTKQMNKRSRNRRRRQKKGMHSGRVSQSSSDDDDCNGDVCFIAESPKFECTVSFQHCDQKPSLVSSFVMTVESESDDDSEWESYDEADNCNVSKLNLDNTIRCVLSPSNSSPVKSDSSDEEMKSRVFSFLAPVGDSCDDDDSEWDTCDADAFTDVTEFEFTGLFIANMCSFHPDPATTDSKFKSDPADETDESLQLRKDLLDANKKWNELSNGDIKKSTSKVTFAADDDLVQVCHVEMIDRKGEWETYATERLRFKRRIDELEKVLSPCFNLEHRTKVFKKLIEPEL